MIFISYSRKNEEEVKKIVNELEEVGQKVFIDYKNIKPGSIFANEIVKGIEDSICCILMLSNESNNSNMVLNEVNSAVNHNKTIIPLKIKGDIELSKAMEFYIGKNNWISYVDKSSLYSIIDIINSITKDEKKNKIKWNGPIVLRYDELEKIGYDDKSKVLETIEIDYLTLGDSPMEFIIDSDIEGEPDKWLEYAKNYPDTASYLVVNDKIVGYSQIEFISDDDYKDLLNGEKMITGDMELFYGFGGEFNCYIAIIPILQKYENQSNYILLFNDLINKLVSLRKEQDVIIKKLAISVYSNLLEKLIIQLGFKFVGKNPAKGKIYQLCLSEIKNNRVLCKKYPDFVKMYEGD